MYMTYSNTRRKKLQKRKYRRGGGIMITWDETRLYGSAELGLSYKHTWALHHYQIDLTDIARIHLDNISRSIYDDKKLTEILNVYGAKIDEFKERNILLLWWEVLFIGEEHVQDPETKVVTIEPICMKADGRFYNRKNEIRSPNYSRKMSEKLGKPVYMFGDYQKGYGNGNTTAFVHEFKSAILEGGNINQSSIYQAVGLYANQSHAKYVMTRTRMSGDQMTAIETFLLNYNVLVALNTDKSINETTKKPEYRTHQQMGFFDVNCIKQSYRKWRGEDMDATQYMKAFFVGFYKKSDNLYRPVYLKPNGWFSDGYYDYSPTFGTIVITKKMLEDNGMYMTTSDHGSYTHEFLVGKIAYLFDWGPNTAAAITYNNYFRWDAVLYQLRWTLLLTGFSAFTAWLYGSTLLSIVIAAAITKTAIGAAKYWYSNKAGGGKRRHKNRWKSYKKKIKSTKRRRPSRQ